MALAKHRKIGSEMAARQLSYFTLRGVLQATATLEFRQSYTTNVVQLQSRCVSVAARSKQVPPSASSEDAMPPAALQDWQGLTGVGGDCLTSEKAKSFFSAVDWGHVVGWPQHLELPRGYEPILKQKRQNPAWLIGHRCKDSQSTLEFIGVDAVVVSELLDRKLSVGAAEKKFTPKKGCPVYSVANSKIEAAVEELCTNHQLEVLLVDRLQAEVAPILQLCTPHQPLVRMGVPGRDLTYGDGEALVAVWNLATRTKWTRQGLVPELLQDQLQALNVTPPVYVLDTPDQGQVSKDLQRLTQALRKLFFDGQSNRKIAVRQAVSLEHVQVPCAPDQFEQAIEQKLQATLTSDSLLDWATVDQGPNMDRLVLHSTAFNLGLLDAGARGIPSLIDAVTQGAASLLTASAPKKRIAALLLTPPEPEIAKLNGQYLNAACRECWKLHVKEEWQTVSNPVALQRFLDFGPTGRSGCVEASLLSDVLRVAKCTLSALESESPEMQQFAESVLCMTTSSVGVNRPVSKDAFVKGLKDLKQVLERVVVDSSDPYRGQSDWELAQIKVNKEIELQKSARKPAMTNAVLDSMKSFFGNYEESTITDIFNKQALPESLRTKLSGSMMSLVDALCSSFTPDGGGYIGLLDPNTSLKYHSTPECLSLYSPKMSSTVLKKWRNDSSLPGAGQGDLLAFEKDVDNSKMRQKCFTTPRISEAQDSYIAAHQAALGEFEDELRRAHALLTGPSTSLPLVLTIMIAKEYTEWGRLITGVSEVAYKENWSIPTLSAGGTTLNLNRFWPYWMHEDDGCVKNDIVLEDSMAVLSGPNMGGKSTALRSITAAVLLGNVGFPIPASPGSQVPQYHSFVCRNFHGDSPLEHRSGFALEANELAVVLELGTPREQAGSKPRTFVCIDEFGKGTEDKHATSMCAASLKHLDERTYNGVFATHQHALFSDRLGLFPSKTGTSPGQLKHTETWCIKGRPELDSEDTLSADTDFLISPGVNTTSLAFQVAASEGVPADVIASAQLWKARVEQLSLAGSPSRSPPALLADTNLNNHVTDPDHAADYSSAQPRPSARQPGDSSLSCAPAGDNVPASRVAPPQTDSQGAGLPSSLRDIGTSLPAALVASCSIPVIPTPGSMSNVESEASAPSARAGEPPARHQNGAAAPESAARTFTWGAQPSASPLGNQQMETLPWEESSADTASVQLSGFSTSTPESHRSQSSVLGQYNRAQHGAQQFQQAATAWQEDLQSVTAILQAEVGRVCGGEDVSCIQLHVAGGQTPGVQYMNLSCVYVLQVTRSSHSLAYYVGESDNVRQRLRTHTKGMKKKFQGAVNAAVVAGLKNREKSTAKKVEASLIRALIEQGYSLLSTSDMNNRSFGSVRV